MCDRPLQTDKIDNDGNNKRKHPAPIRPTLSYATHNGRYTPCFARAAVITLELKAVHTVHGCLLQEGTTAKASPPPAPPNGA